MMLPKQFLRPFYARFRHMILYSLIGLLTSVFDFAIYTLLIYVISIHYLIANVISVLLSIPISFILNRNVNFMTREKPISRFITFLMVSLFGILFTDIILYVCIEVYYLDRISSKLVSILSVGLLQFLLNKYVTFKPVNQYDT